MATPIIATTAIASIHQVDRGPRSLTHSWPADRTLVRAYGDHARDRADLAESG